MIDMEDRKELKLICFSAVQIQHEIDPPRW